jgi:cytochrome c2
MPKWNNVGILVAGTFMVFAQSALAAGDVENGKKVYKKCAACHSLEEGKKKVGPTLYGVFGRTSGQLEGFKFSKALVAAEIVWDETTIDAYIADPKGYIPKNRMAFAGLKKEQDRADVIAYIKENAQ